MSRLQRMTKMIYLIGVGIFALAMIGCKPDAEVRTATALIPIITSEPTTTPMPSQVLEQLLFETIEITDLGPSTGDAAYVGKIRVEVIASPSDIVRIEGWISRSTERQLKKLDYEESYALAVFRGTHASGGYRIKIVNITRKNDTVIVQVKLQFPQPGHAYVDLVTSPYHVVEIPKTGNWGAEITFNVMDGSDMIFSSIHFVP